MDISCKRGYKLKEGRTLKIICKSGYKKNSCKSGYKMILYKNRDQSKTYGNNLIEGRNWKRE